MGNAACAKACTDEAVETRADDEARPAYDVSDLRIVDSKRWEVHSDISEADSCKPAPCDIDRTASTPRNFLAEENGQLDSASVRQRTSVHRAEDDQLKARSHIKQADAGVGNKTTSSEAMEGLWKWAKQWSGDGASELTPQSQAKATDAAEAPIEHWDAGETIAGVWQWARQLSEGLSSQPKPQSEIMQPNTGEALSSQRPQNSQTDADEALIKAKTADSKPERASHERHISPISTPKTGRKKSDDSSSTGTPKKTPRKNSDETWSSQGTPRTPGKKQTWQEKRLTDKKHAEEKHREVEAAEEARLALALKAAEEEDKRRQSEMSQVPIKFRLSVKVAENWDPDRPVGQGQKHYFLKNTMFPPWPKGMEEALFGMGCFWCAESLFMKLPGVFSTHVGYAGGKEPHPTYKSVNEDASSAIGRQSCKQDHAKVVRIVYDPKKLSYERLLKIFWEGHDPTQGDKQGRDEGYQYRSFVGCYNSKQQMAILTTKDTFQHALELHGIRRQITTEIRFPAPHFWYAEDIHQQHDARPGNEPYGGLAPIHGVTLS